MPVVNIRLMPGDMIRCIGMTENAFGMWDTTVGKMYTIAGVDYEGDVYFLDDKGEKNYSASPDGDVLFELV